MNYMENKSQLLKTVAKISEVTMQSRRCLTAIIYAVLLFKSLVLRSVKIDKELLHFATVEPS